MIEKLPELVLAEVFRHLQIYDQLTIRPVCKSWKAIVEKELLSRRELILFNKNCPRALFWFHDGSPVDLSNSLISNDRFKRSQFFWQVFKNIRRLYIVCHEEFIHEPDHLEFVNRFTQLEHLQVDVLPYDVVRFRPSLNLKIEYVLNLRNLKSFCCQKEEWYMQFRILNSPRLEIFAAPCSFQFNKRRSGSFRESLKFLKVKDYNFKRGFFFPNLESFHFQMFPTRSVNRLQIADHPKLKEIQLYWNFYKGACQSMNTFEQENEQLNELFKQKERLKRAEPGIFLFGFRWSPETAEERTRLPKSYLMCPELELFLENSEDLKLEHSKRNLIYNIYFDHYMVAFDEQQIERLARCIEVVEFLQILGNNSALTAKYQTLFRYVKILILSEQFQEQRDLDRLPELFPHLLEIREGSEVSFIGRGNDFEASRNPAAFPNLFRKAFNFQFLAKFPALTYLETDRWRFSRGEFEGILQSCRFLRVAKFSRRRLIGSLEAPIRTEYSIYTISLRSTAIKMQVERHRNDHVPLTANQMNDPQFDPYRTKKFSSLQELLGYLSFDWFFFEEN